MNITTPEALSAAIWKRLLLCCPLVIVVVAIVTIRLTYLATDPTTVPRQLVEMASLRIGLLLTFHSAPTAWIYLIYKIYRQRLITISIYQSIALLRMPLATWTAGCLMAAIFIWPMLNG